MVKKDTRKNQRVGKINGHTITQTLDFSDVTKDYKKWKEIMAFQKCKGQNLH